MQSLSAILQGLCECDACILCVMMHLNSACVHAGQQMPAGGPQTGPEVMDQIQQRLSDPATADLISAFTQTMKPEDLAGLLKSGGMDVTPKQVRALCLPAEACGLSCAGASPANHAMYDLLSLVVATSLMLSLLLQTMLLLHGKGFRKLCIQV